MKKIFSIILCAVVVLVSGCSAGSQEAYNSVFEEKTELKYDNDKLKGEIAELQSELEALKTEKTELEQAHEKLQERIDITGECICIDARILGRPQSSIVDNEVTKYDDNVDLETTLYMEGTHFSSKIVHTIKDDLSPIETAIHMATYEKATADRIVNLLDDDLRELVIIYRNYNEGNGSIIAHSFWYFDDNEDNVIQRRCSFTTYGKNKGVMDEFYKIVENF